MFSLYELTTRQFVASVFYETLVQTDPLNWLYIVTLTTFEGFFLVLNMFSIYGVTTRQFVASVFYETIVQAYPLLWPSIVTLANCEWNLECKVTTHNSNM